jgi:hypothetical protein
MQSSALDALLRASICLCDLQSCREKQTAGRYSTAGNVKSVQVHVKDVYSFKKTDDCSWNGDVTPEHLHKAIHMHTLVILLLDREHLSRSLDPFLG